ncbi:MAG: hypothetical protein IT310_01775 [Anaerolineales bacterium]|nr:hypothetical protein [Anaerolineales bacterium]
MEKLAIYQQTSGYIARQERLAEWQKGQVYKDFRASETGSAADEWLKDQAYNDFRARESADGAGWGDEDIQYDLTGWMPLAINRNIASPELADMEYYDDRRHLKLYDLIAPVITAPIRSVFSGLWVSELFGDFLSLNTGGGRWDIKLEMQDKFRNGMGDKDAAHILCSNSGTCAWVDYSTAGNVLYGATAADVGIPRWMSKLAGGLLEIRDGTAKWENWWNAFEDPYDTSAVNFGYDLYENTEGVITEEAFRDALTDEVLNSLQSPPGGFKPPFEAQPQINHYPADGFDHPETEKNP